MRESDFECRHDSPGGPAGGFFSLLMHAGASSESSDSPTLQMQAMNEGLGLVMGFYRGPELGADRGETGVINDG
jgi:hypothetical protein